MRTWLARHIFYPIQDRLCGRQSLRCAAWLDESQWFQTKHLRELQLTKLRQLLRHAQRHVPFYAQRIADAGLRVDRITGREELSALPVLTKSEIRANREALTARGRRLTDSSTSGSTGSPLIFGVCDRRQQSDVASRLRAHRWFDIRPGDAAIYLWGSRIEISNQDRLRAIRDWLINEKLLSAFTLSDDQLQRYCDCFFRVRPQYMYSYASSLYRFAQFVHAHRPELKGVVRKVAFSSGERMLPQWRAQIIQFLECSVAEEYGCREGGLIAHECPQGRYHEMAENIIVEILDDSDCPVAAGEEGRIVITNLEAYGMPFIRYDTGDRAAQVAEGCECGRTLPVITRPAGRTFEMLETNDGTQITGVSLSRDIKEIEGIEAYRVIQETRRQVRILLVPSSRYDKTSARRRLQQFVHARIGPATKVLIEELDQLPAHSSGKYYYVMNAITS